MSISFPGGMDPLVTADRLRNLADDLERLTMFTPSGELLAVAPRLINWSPWARQVPALLGHVHGHPILDETSAVTSEVYAIDKVEGWARTFSRFYVLDTRLERGGASDNPD